MIPGLLMVTGNLRSFVPAFMIPWDVATTWTSDLKDKVSPFPAVNEIGKFFEEKPALSSPGEIPTAIAPDADARDTCAKKEKKINVMTSNIGFQRNLFIPIAPN